MVLQCSGNGRGYFPSKPSGTPWQVGAAGCVMWSGVPVRVVAEALGGVVPGAGFLTGTGGEKLPEGLDPLSIIVERSVPAAAMADALLAWEMNGVPISLAHGGPLRLIVPGYTGVNNIKYIKRLAFTAKETEAKIMSHGYRISPPGGKGDPSQPSVQEMTVKSWINSPAPDAASVKAGLVQVQGVAFGGLNGGQARRGVAGRRQDLERRAAHRARPGPLCLAAVRAGRPSCRPAATRWPAAPPTRRATCSPNSAWKTPAATTTRAGPTTP